MDHGRPSLGTAVLLALLLALVSACAAEGPAHTAANPVTPSAAPTAEPDTTAAALRDATGRQRIAPPPQVEVSPAPPTRPEVPPQVEVAQPDLLVRPETPYPGAAAAAHAVEGVDRVAGVSEFEATFELPPPPASVGAETAAGPARPDPEALGVHVLGIDPLEFRPLTPDVTAQEPGVWERLLDGDVVVRHDVAQELGLELGGTYTLVGPAGRAEVRIGAFASNGAPPLAEVLVPWELGIRLGAGDVNLLVVSLADGADAKDVGAALVDRIAGGDFTVRSAPEEQQARIVSTGQTTFEPFNYLDLGDGMIVIDPAWVAKWIAPVELPGLGVTRCHRMMIPQLLAALREIHAEGLYGHFKPEQFGGCWVPRHIDWDPSKPLSMHAWGLAIDLNTHDNWLGQPPRMDPRIVAIFEKWGFEWGGRWSRPDGMHFELDRVIQVEG